MVAAAVDLHPALAKEIVQRGHEALLIGARSSSGVMEVCAVQVCPCPERKDEIARFAWGSRLTVREGT
jgi:hypothetical protein